MIACLRHRHEAELWDCRIREAREVKRKVELVLGISAISAMGIG